MTQSAKPFITSKRVQNVDSEVSALAVAMAAQCTAGLSLTHVPTGREAIELLKVLRFDLVLIPPAVPDMSAWTLAETVRQFWPWQRWALIALDASDADVRRAGERGAVGVFSGVSQELAELRINTRNHTGNNKRCTGWVRAQKKVV